MHHIHYSFCFFIPFILLSVLALYCDQKYHMLRDVSIADKRPFSYARVQLAWWSVIVLSAIISVMLDCGEIPTLPESTLYLMGISSATTITARVIDVNDQTNPALLQASLIQNQTGQNFLFDILSDKNGISIQRFQTFVLNISFGMWFIIKLLSHLKSSSALNDIIPDIDGNNLILLGLSSGAYAGLKATENKQPAAGPAALAADPIKVTDNIG